MSKVEATAEAVKAAWLAMNGARKDWEDSLKQTCDLKQRWESSQNDYDAAELALKRTI